MLDEQTISVPLAQGIDSKSDETQLPVGKLAALSNASFQSPKKLKKRPGHATLSTLSDWPEKPSAGTTLNTGRTLASYRGELLLGDGTILRSYVPATGRWSVRGGLSSVGVSLRSVVRNPTEQFNPDSAYHATAGVYCYVWQESINMFGAIVDATSGAIMLRFSRSLAYTPKVFAFGKYLVVSYVTSSGPWSLKYIAIDTSTSPFTFAADVTVTATMVVSGNFDATVIGSRLYFAFDESTPDVGLRYLDASLTLSAAVTFTGPATASLAIAAGSSGDLLVAWSDGAALKFRVYDANLSNTLTTTTADAAANAVRIAPLALSFAHQWLLLYEIAGPRVRTVTVSTGVVGTPADYQRGAGLASKTWWLDRASQVLCVLFVTSSTQQASYFLSCNQYPLGTNPVAKVLYGVAGPLRSAHNLPEANALGAGVYHVAVTEKRNLSTFDGYTFTQAGVDGVTFDFRQRGAASAEAAESIHFSGGFLATYDGAHSFEHGFHLYPEGVSVPNPGGANVYQYVACYEWTDNRGQIHRSAPSPAVTQAQTNPISAFDTVTVTLPTLRMLGMARSDDAVRIVVYRTLVNEGIFRRVPAPGTETVNSTTVDTLAFVDSLTDAQIQGNPTLYTTGGVLENIAPGPLGHMTVYANRVIAIDAEHPTALWRSHQVVPGAPLEFSDFTKYNVDARGGACTALATLDDKLIIFKAGAVVVVAGQGPDRTGANDDWGAGVLLPSDVGCVNPRSIVQAAAGIGFQSSKGYYLLDRSLNTQYVGAEAEGFNAGTIVGSQINPARTQTRLMLSTGRELVYDDLVGQWGTWEPEAGATATVDADTGTVIVPSVVDVCLYQGAHAYLRSDGVVKVETAGAYLDGATPVPLSFRTGWISFAGLQGYQRVRRLQLLGEYLSAHSLTAGIAYDYDPTIVQTVTFTGASPEQWVTKLARQKCQSIQLTVTEIAGGGEGLSLSAIAFEVGIARKLYKQPKSRTAGTT